MHNIMNLWYSPFLFKRRTEMSLCRHRYTQQNSFCDVAYFVWGTGVNYRVKINFFGRYSQEAGQQASQIYP